VEILDLMNDDVFGAGISLPYQKLSMLSSFTFKPHFMGMVIELLYNQ